MIRKQFIFFIFLLVSLTIFGQKNDSVVTKKSLFIIPHAAYQQETSWSAGVAGGYYFKSNDISRISSVSGSMDYTLLNQFIFNITPKIYLADKKWYLYSNLNFRNYPDYFYGIGNSPTEVKEALTVRNFSLVLQPQYSFTNEIFAGPLFSYRNESVVLDAAFEEDRTEIYERFGSAGWTPFSQLNIGVVASFDSRDNQFYPQKGIFAKSTFSTSNTGLGSTFSVTDFTLDFRNYLPVFKNHIFGWQALYTGVFSKNEIPFQLLPTVGGRDYLRGFRQGMYRENVLMLLQTEYRLPIYKRLKAAFFCSAGDVVNSSNYQIDKLKVAYGAGLRYRLNDARVHLRFDIAKNNYGEKLQFYITATEAF
ncbi:MAG TPA: BamA/TamA family outer membrane protein [Paludibacter sp.]|nr:BamA/TamA family outer membrane protein [Paludibacter sp.]